MKHNDENRLPRPQDLPSWHSLTEEEKIDAVGAWVLETYRQAFEALSK